MKRTGRCVLLMMIFTVPQHYKNRQNFMWLSAYCREPGHFLKQFTVWKGKRNRTPSGDATNSGSCAQDCSACAILSAAYIQGAANPMWLKNDGAQWWISCLPDRDMIWVKRRNIHFGANWSTLMENKVSWHRCFTEMVCMTKAYICHMHLVHVSQ